MGYYILFLPLAASIISGFFGKLIGDKASQLVTSLFVSISAFLSIIVLYNVIATGYSENLIIATWINSGSLNVNWSVNIDPLSAVMLVVVTLVSAIVHIYSIGYMSHDPHKSRFMSYLSLFTFAMLTLFKSDNFIQSNIKGVHNLLEILINNKKIKLIHISTDEVFGNVKKNLRTIEESPYKPLNPYAATNAASDHLINSYINT